MLLTKCLMKWLNKVSASAKKVCIWNKYYFSLILMSLIKCLMKYLRLFYIQWEIESALHVFVKMPLRLELSLNCPRCWPNRTEPSWPDRLVDWTEPSSSWGQLVAEPSRLGSKWCTPLHTTSAYPFTTNYPKHGKGHHQTIPTPPENSAKSQPTTP